jgi:hypothetical protein
MQADDFYFAIAIEAAGNVSIQCILVLIDSVVYHITHIGKFEFSIFSTAAVASRKYSYE